MPRVHRAPRSSIGGMIHNADRKSPKGRFVRQNGPSPAAAAHGRHCPIRSRRTHHAQPVPQGASAGTLSALRTIARRRTMAGTPNWYVSRGHSNPRRCDDLHAGVAPVVFLLMIPAAPRPSQSQRPCHRSRRRSESQPADSPWSLPAPRTAAIRRKFRFSPPRADRARPNTGNEAMKSSPESAGHKHARGRVIGIRVTFRELWVRLNDPRIPRPP